VRNSYIGPYTSVGNNCTVADSEIEHSVLLDGSSIADINRMSDSLVGRNVTVKRSAQRPSALRLMLGDDSTVEVE
jgi:glucose-1-phosphate thymidylyltransferase